MKIMTNSNWVAGSAGLMSHKAPTCLLFDADKKFLSFGYDAEDAYAGFALDNNTHHQYYFFRKFKMKLHRNMVGETSIMF